MTRARWVAAAVVATALVAVGAVSALSGGGGEVAAAITTTSSTSTTVVTTTSATAVTATEPTTTTSAPAVHVLERGGSGDDVLQLQRRLAAVGLDPGPADGAFGVGTMYAVQAFQKLHGMAPDGRAGPEVMAALDRSTVIEPLVPDGGPDRVEVDLRRQLLMLYKGGTLRLVTHVSTGSGERYCVEGSCNNRAITPVGSFRFAWRYSGWRQSRLGKLYNPVYFTSSGVAVHGALSVPTYPASHGCVRIPMHIAEYFPSLVRRGDPVYVLDGQTAVGPATTPSGPPPEDPPTQPDTTQPEDTTTTQPDDTTTTTTTAPPATTSTTEPRSEPETTTTTAPADPLLDPAP